MSTCFAGFDLVSTWCSLGVHLCPLVSTWCPLVSIVVSSWFQVGFELVATCDPSTNFERNNQPSRAIASGDKRSGKSK